MNTQLAEQISLLGGTDGAAEIIKILISDHRNDKEQSSKRAFIRALIETKNQCADIVKTAQNDQTGSNYAKYKDVSDAVDPIMETNGFAASFSMDPDGSPLSSGDVHYIRVKCELMHKDGWIKNYTYDLPRDDSGIQGKKNKTAVHGDTSSFTYGRRYLKLSIFDLVVTDEDIDGNVDETATIEMIDAADYARIIAALKERGKNVKKHTDYWIGHYGKHPVITAFPAMPKADVDPIIESFGPVPAAENTDATE